MDPKAQTYFAYGSNLNRHEMRRRCPNAQPQVTASLHGWRLAFRGVADIEPAEGRLVHGALWSLADRGIEALDLYEGAPTHYRRRLVEVSTAAGIRSVIAYVMTDPSYLGLPSPLYLERIAAGYRDWGLPESALGRAVRETRIELERLGEPVSFGAPRTTNRV